MVKSFFLKNWPIILLVLLSFLVSWPIFRSGYFSHHDDLQVMRIFEMRKCFLDYQIPCRWVPDMGFGNGYPLFNYYSILPYYIGGFLSFFVGYIAAAKLLFLIPLVLGGLSLYFLALEIFGRIPAFLAGVLFLFAPYRALDTYVRGAVAENFAMAIFPLVLLFAHKLTKNYSNKYFIGLTFSLSAFLISHNIMVLLFSPIFILLTLYWAKKYGWNNFKPLLMAGVLSIGISSFFTFPAFLERDLVQIDNLVRLDLDFRAHYVTIEQLFFDRFWGYGASFPGPSDTISFQIGWPHWWIVILAFFVFVFSLKKRFNFLLFLFFLIFLFSVFMTHNKSAFIWENIGILRFAQFPWRFLAVTIFSSSLIGAYFISKLPQKFRVYFVVALSLLTIILNFGYFKPEKFDLSLTDKQKLSGELWEKQQKAAILDYIPKTALEPQEPAPKNPLIISGEAQTFNFDKKSNSFKFDAKVSQTTIIEVPIFDFPNWTVYVNEKVFNHSHDNFVGRIRIDLPPGDYKIEGIFKNTLIRTVSNIITLVSITILILLKLYGRRFFR